MLLLKYNSLKNKVLNGGLILILVLLLFSCTEQIPTVYTVSFDANGGTFRGKQSVIVVEGMPVPAPEDPTRSGYNFVGWYIQGEGTEYDFTLPVTSNLTLEAIWSQITPYYTVTFNANLPDGVDTGNVSGMPESINNIPSGETVKEPEKDPARNGYQFDAWYSDSECAAPYDFSSPVTADITLYAKWNPIVTFDANVYGCETVEVPEPVATENGKISKPADPIREGYSFLHWSAESDGTAFDFNTAITEPKTLYAVWKKQFTVIFDANGGTFCGEQSVTVVEGTPVPEPENPTRYGYNFVDWYIQGTDTEYDFTLPVTSDLTLEAIWAEIIPYYRITFDANLPDGGDGLSGMPETMEVVSGGTARKPENPTRSGYNFVGWYSDANTTIPYDFDTPVTSSITLYAKWAVKTWTVSFQSDGGTEIDSQSVINCNKAVKPDNPEKEGHTFEGWYYDQGFTNPYDFNSPVTADITLYAKWIQITYTVTFDANLPDGVDDDSLSGVPETINSIPSGESVGKKTDPTLDGYVFKGWYRTENPDEDEDAFNLALDPVQENMILYAKWSTEATVTFNSNGGSFTGETEMTVTYGGTLTELPADPALKKDGRTYIFLGWYVDGELFDLSEPITNDTTVEAKWSDSYSNNAGYFVYDAEGLIAWAEAAQRDMDLNCTLEKDIILPDVSAGERNWTAADPTLGYTGTFDGNSKTIMNLAGNQGIFGHIGEGGTVKSLTLENVSISSSSRVGAIAGFNQGTIEDCSVSGNIKGGEYVGGICGYNNVGKITDCHFSGSVEGTKSVGGVCGQSFYNSTITACYSTGSVSGSESVGGVCGATLEGTLIACYSTSHVKGTYEVGGVCGYLDEGTLTACYSTGSVEGKSWVGAVCGNNNGGYYSSSTIAACYWSVPSTTSSLVGIGFGNSPSAETVEVNGVSVTWTDGDNNALSAMNAAISQNYKYAENTNPGTNAEMPLVLVPKR